jgi:3-hydroxymyristoyl/3-hydroxydecanoyl-(acyl carrier protein) dehydratase
MKYPVFELTARSESSAEIEFHAEPELIWFDGHFQNEKILPGVAVIGFLLHCMKEFLNMDLENHPYTIQQIKFNAAIRPDMHLKLEIKGITNEEEGGRVNFSLTEKHEGKLCCSGRLKW